MRGGGSPWSPGIVRTGLTWIPPASVERGIVSAYSRSRRRARLKEANVMQLAAVKPGRQATPEARPEGYAAAGWRQHSSPGCAKERWERAQRSVATFPGQNVDMDKLHSGHADHTGHAGHGAGSDGHSAHNYSVAHTHTSTQRTHSSRSPPKPKAHSVPHRLRAQQPRERPPYRKAQERAAGPRPEQEAKTPKARRGLPR